MHCSAIISDLFTLVDLHLFLNDDTNMWINLMINTGITVLTLFLYIHFLYFIFSLFVLNISPHSRLLLIIVVSMFL